MSDKGDCKTATATPGLLNIPWQKVLIKKGFKICYFGSEMKKRKKPFEHDMTSNFVLCDRRLLKHPNVPKAI